MKANINGVEVSGTVEEISLFVKKLRTKRKYKNRVLKHKKHRKQISKGEYQKIIKQIATIHKKTKQSLGYLIEKYFKRQAGGTDYINIRKLL